MAAGNGQAGFRADKIAGGDFMRGISGGEIASDGIAVDRAACAVKPCGQRGLVKRHGRITGDGMAARNAHHRIIAERSGEPGTADIRLGKADHHKADPAVLSFDQRVGGERGGNRDEFNESRSFARLRQHTINST